MLLEILLVILMMNLLLDVRTITFIDYMLLVDKSYAGGVLPSKPFIVLVFLVVDVFPRSTDECLHAMSWSMQVIIAVLASVGVISFAISSIYRGYRVCYLPLSWKDIA